MKKVIIGFVIVLIGSGIYFATKTINNSGTTNSLVENSTEMSNSKEKIELVDGKYTLEEKNDINGYRHILKIEINNGYISSSIFDAIDKNGESIRADFEYKESIFIDSGVSLDMVYSVLPASLMGSNGEFTVEKIKGAEETSNKFKEYAEILIEQASSGDRETIMIDNK